jgi:hypothetical protein
MTTESTSDRKPMRGTFRFLNVRVGAGNYRNMEVESGGSLSVTEITSSKTEEEIRAAMLADGYIEVDRDGHPISVLDNILRNEKAQAILQDAVKKLKKIGIEGLVQPLVSPVDHTVGWFLIVAKDHADVKCLRALLTAGCDVCGADHAQYARALDMISVLEEQA